MTMPSEEDAVQFLENHGYILTSDLDWIAPEEVEITDAELGAILYLNEHHEFGGFHGVKGRSNTISWGQPAGADSDTDLGSH